MAFNVVITRCGDIDNPISVACFENICEKCHLPSLTNRNDSYLPSLHVYGFSLISTSHCL